MTHNQWKLLTREIKNKGLYPHAIFILQRNYRLNRLSYKSPYDPIKNCTFSTIKGWLERMMKNIPIYHDR